MLELPVGGVTGIGSVPFTDAAGAVQLILRHAPQIPFWPQMVVRGFREDMVSQGCGGFAPLLERDDDRKVVRLNAELAREEALTAFYETALSGDLAPFGLTRDEAEGFFALLAAVDGLGPQGPPVLKGQVIGPVTFAAMVKLPGGKALLSDAELLEAVIRGLGLKAAWQADQFRRLGKAPLIFFDEPSLTGFGSAFMPISREEVVGALTATIQVSREHGELLTGVHCCGNTDWGMLLQAPIDVLSFDAYGFFDTLMLYDRALKDFLERGGWLAFGLAPTLPDSPAETADSLWDRFQEQLAALEAKGFSRNVILSRLLWTPACGLGYLTPAQSEGVLATLAELSARGRRLLAGS